MRLAVIGSGVSGLVTAYLLRDQYEVRIFEAGDRIGGHVHTRTITDARGPQAVDSGFIVFNDWTYPRFIKLIDELQVASLPSDMSFSVVDPQRDLEYNGHSLGTLFAQRRNLLRPRFHGMIRDILRFNRRAPAAVAADGDLTLGEYLERERFGDWFREAYLVPMGAAIWSSASGDVLAMPLRFFVQFFANHGMLNVSDRPQWRVISGGSQRYVEALLDRLPHPVITGTPIRGVTRHADGVRLRTDADDVNFDAVVFACHADQALAVLDDATPRERELLGAFRFSRNPTTLHTDRGQLPQRRRAWAAWNFHREHGAERAATVTYHMNRLQSLAAEREYLVSLNRDEHIDDEQVLERMVYEHPLYSVAAVAAQSRVGEISGHRRSHFCGAYWRNGFHEDGVVSAERVAGELGVTW